MNAHRHNRLNEHMHRHSFHDMMLRMEHMFHEEKFWAILGLCAFLALLLGLSVWAAMSSNGNVGYQQMPYFPLYNGVP